jgi:hypothetical protein
MITLAVAAIPILIIRQAWFKLRLMSLLRALFFVLVWGSPLDRPPRSPRELLRIRLDLAYYGCRLDGRVEVFLI